MDDEVSLKNDKEFVNYQMADFCGKDVLISVLTTYDRQLLFIELKRLNI
jgi:hypothetical protein